MWDGLSGDDMWWEGVSDSSFSDRYNNVCKTVNF